MKFGQTIKTQRERLGWDQSDLARRLGEPVGQQTVSRWERGASRPRRNVVLELAEILGIDQELLMDAAGYTEQAMSAAVRPRALLLPAWELSAEQFEHLVTDIARALRPETMVSRFGGQGHTQHGVDIVAQVDSRYVQTYQCKRHAQFGPKDVEDAVRKVTLEADAHCLVLSRKSASPLARRALLAHPGWTLWDAEDLSRIVRGLPLETSVRIVDTFFPGWREPFLGVAEEGPWLTADEYFRPVVTGPLYHHDWPLVGRATELRSLVTFATGTDGRCAMVTGRGGTGKSKLLFEAARAVASKGVAVRCLKQAADVRPEHQELLPRQGPVLVLVDDAHERSDVTALVNDLLRHNADAKLVLALRPHGLEATALALRPLGISRDNWTEIELRDLELEDAESLAAEALGPAWPRQLAEDLGRLTRDCPFITVVAGVLIRRGKLEPSCVEHEETIQQRVLETFHDVVIGEMKSPNAEQRRDFLDALALLQPFRGDDPSFRRMLGELVGAPYDRLLRHLVSLEGAGILLRRKDSLRIVPDLLGDVILTKACFGPSWSASGFIERAWSAAADEEDATINAEAARHLFINAARVDWQVRHDHPESVRLTNILWDAVDSTAQGAGVRSRIELLKLVQQTAYFEPRRSLKLSQWMMDHPTEVVEDSGAGGTGHNTGYDAVLQEIPGVLRTVAYTFEHLRPAAEMLWQLAKRDKRATNQFPEHPLRVLQGFAEHSTVKPAVYSAAMIDLAEEWLLKASPRLGEPSAFDVIDPILSTEGTDDSADGFRLRMRPFIVLPDVVAPLRRRVVDLALRELGSSDAVRAARAVRFIEASLRPPIGLFGRDVSSDERAAWTPDHLVTLRSLRAAVRSMDLVPVIGVSLRCALYGHLDEPEEAIGEAVRAVMSALPQSLEHLVAVALFDGWGELLVGAPADVQTMDQARDQKMRELAQCVIEEWPVSRIADVLERELAALQAAFSGQSGRLGMPDPFIALLVESRPALGVVLTERAAVAAASPLRAVLTVVLGRLLEVLPDEAKQAIQDLLGTTDVALRRSVAFAMGWYRRSEGTMRRWELDVLIELAKDADLGVRRGVALSLRRLATWSGVIPFAVLNELSFSDSPELTEEVLQIFVGGDGLYRWQKLADLDMEAIYNELILCPSIEPFWTQGFIAGRSAKDPKAIVHLLMRRIEHWETMDSDSDYRALPFGWHHPLQASRTPAFVFLLREVSSWLSDAPRSWKRQWAGGELFGVIAGTYDDPDVRQVLTEMLIAPTEDTITSMASILRNAPRETIFADPGFIKRILEAASLVGEESFSSVAGAMHGAVVSGSGTRAPGQPAARDIEQRDRAIVAADQLPPGSPAEQFYRSLQRSAEEHMRWDLEADEKLADGRRW